jgi:two-component system sensor histidine kinase HupT/HoxJ
MSVMPTQRPGPESLFRPGVNAGKPQAERLQGIDDATWMDVIQKMEEVYSQLLRDEVALEEKNGELEQSQQFIFSLLSAMSDVLVACDNQGRIEETNAALCELVGRSDAELRGTSVFALLADEASVQRLQAVMAGPRASPGRVGDKAPRVSEGIEINLLDAEHRAVPVDLNCTPRINAANRPVGRVFVGRPMAEIKRAYQQLRQTHEALKSAQAQLLQSEKMASLGRLVAGVAHELNNPISFVLGNMHALQRYTTRLSSYLDAVHAGTDAATLATMRQRLRIDHLRADLPSLIEGTIEGAQRTADIVGGLKRFSAIDRQDRELLDLHDVVERAVHWVRKGTAPGFAVHLVGGPPCAVRGSSGQLLQVVMNLVQNAYDAAQEAAQQRQLKQPGASVEGPTLWIGSEVTNGRVRLQLRDNGAGISDMNLGRIFDPFFTTKPVGKGTGLGLSISYGIVEQHGGQLTAGNHPDGGAVFVVELPLADPKEPR